MTAELMSLLLAFGVFSDECSVGTSSPDSLNTEIIKELSAYVVYEFRWETINYFSVVEVTTPKSPIKKMKEFNEDNHQNLLTVHKLKSMNSGTDIF